MSGASGEMVRLVDMFGIAAEDAERGAALYSERTTARDALLGTIADLERNLFAARQALIAEGLARNDADAEAAALRTAMASQLQVTVTARQAVSDVVCERDRAIARAEGAEADLAECRAEIAYRKLMSRCFDAGFLGHADADVEAVRHGTEGGLWFGRGDRCRRWHAARRILDGAREAHGRMTPGPWRACDGSAKADGAAMCACGLVWSTSVDAAVLSVMLGHNETGGASTDNRADGPGIVADHAAMGELLRLGE